MAEITDYSTTAASNNTASPGGWPEGMAPSGVNDSDRELAARIKRWYEDTSAVNTSGGSSNAYTLSASRTISAYAAGQVFVFVANHSNTGSATLNVDSVGAKTIKKNHDEDLIADDIKADQIVFVVYQATDDIFELLNSRLSSSLDSRGYGMELSNNATDSDHDIDIAAGRRLDSTDAAMIVLSAITKRLDASYTAGDGNGGLSSSLTLSANTFYHAFAVIDSGGNHDVMFDSSVSGANIDTDHSPSNKQRIGAVLTDSSSNVEAFYQIHNYFFFVDFIDDVADANVSSWVTATVSVPPNQMGVFHLEANAGSGGAGGEIVGALLRKTGTSRGTGIGMIRTSLNGTNSNDIRIEGVVQEAVDASSQVDYELSVSDDITSPEVHIDTIGWLDDRGLL